MSKQREALESAKAAMMAHGNPGPIHGARFADAINKINAALAEPEQPPLTGCLYLHHQRINMTKNEAREILIKHNAWRRCVNMPMQNQQAIGMAIDAVCEPPSIAQSIRNAAINWPQYLGDVECGVLNAFCSFQEKYMPTGYLRGNYPEKLKNQSRTFMLFVAEALE